MSASEMPVSRQSPLEKLGLKPEDDKDGLILHALHILEGYALNTDQRLEDTDAFAAAKILIEECGNVEPDLIAAVLVRPIATGSDPDLIAETLTPRVAGILSGLYDLIPKSNDPDAATEAMENAEPAVRYSLLTINIEKIESALREHGEKPLSANITVRVHGMGEFPLSNREFFEDLRESLGAIGDIIKKDMNEPGLEARFDRGIAALDRKLSPDTAPGFGGAFRSAASIENALKSEPAALEPAAAPGKKPPSPGSYN